MRFGIQTSLNNVEWREIEDMWTFLDRDTQVPQRLDVRPLRPAGRRARTRTPTASRAGPRSRRWPRRTERIRLGCLVTGVTYREPAVLAKMAATIDHVSGGRLEFGIGAAWHAGEHEMYGIPFPGPKEREDRLEEAVQVIRMLFDSDGRSTSTAATTTCTTPSSCRRACSGRTRRS